MCPTVVLWWLLTLDPPGRRYHPVTVSALASTLWTHVEVEGLVVYVRHQHDGDWHITIAAEGKLAVVEVIPAIPLPVPPRGSWVRVRGISRYDRDHGWQEIHPAEQIFVLRPPPHAERPDR